MQSGSSNSRQNNKSNEWNLSHSWNAFYSALLKGLFSRPEILFLKMIEPNKPVNIRYKLQSGSPWHMVFSLRTYIQCVSLDSTSFVIYREIKAAEVTISAAKLHLCSFYFRIYVTKLGGICKETHRIYTYALYAQSKAILSVRPSVRPSIPYWISHPRISSLALQ